VSALRVRAGAPNEDRFGFAQAVRSGSVTWVAGQVGKDNATGAMTGPATLAGRTARALLNVEAAVVGAGGTAGDVTSLQVHLAAGLMTGRELVAAAVGERFGRPGPAVTAVALDGLSHPEYLVEVSAVAVTEEDAVPRIAVPTADPVAATAALGGPAAVRVGPHVHVAGQPGLGDGPAAALGDAVARFETALAGAGAALADVVAHHLFVVGPVDAGGFAELCDAHRAAFGAHPPAATLVLVEALPDPDARVLLSGVAHLD
jgi:enamine deaminase RidA (YjgF/YER057c/UK114 family)